MSESQKGSNTLQIWRIYEMDQRLEQLRPLMGLAPQLRDWVLRHHEDGDVEGSEIEDRDNLDALLHGISVMEIGFQVGALEDPHGKYWERLKPILSNAEVQSFFISRYPLSLPQYFLQRASHDHWLTEDVSGGYDWYSGVISLDARFRDTSLEVFLSLIDGFWFDELNYEKLNQAVRRPGTVRKAVTTAREDRSPLQEAIAGLERFVTFADDLDKQISCAPTSILGEAQMNLYRYWFVEPRKNLRHVIFQTLRALEEVEGRNPENPSLNALDRLFRFAELNHEKLDYRVHTKADLVAAIASQAGVTRVQAKRALDAFTDTVLDALANGLEIRLIGLGTFSPVQIAKEKHSPYTKVVARSSKRGHQTGVTRMNKTS